MRTLELVVLCLTLCSFAHPQAGAVGKITADPNAPRLNVAAAESKTDSASLAQKVTYKAERKTVSAILSDLSQMTGVTLRAGQSNQDWQVRDRKMNIFAKDTPLSNMMNSIARVMKFQWSKSTTDDGTVSYRLYMDRQTLLGEEHERYVMAERLRQRQADARREFVSELAAAVGMPDGELNSSATPSAYTDAMARLGWADLFANAFAEVPGAREAFLAGQELSIDIGSASAAVRQSLANMQYGIGEWGSLDQATLTLNHYAEPSGNYFGDIGNATIKLRERVLQTTFFDPASDRAKALAGLISAQGMPGSDAEADDGELKRCLDLLRRAESQEQVNLDEPVTEHPSDPALSQKVKMDGAGEDFPDTLSVLAKESGFAIVSDSFYRRLGLSFPKEEIEVRAVLDELESACRYNWERHGTTIELHDRAWFRKRAAQIPDAWLEAWRSAFVDNGFLDIDDLSEMAMLTADQFSVNILADDVLGKAGLFRVAADYQDMLRLYARLSKKQRSLIFTPQGLLLDSVRDDQGSAVNTLLRNCTIPGGTSQKGLALVGTRSKSGKQISYVFHVNTPSGNTSSTRWKILCPVYSPPADSTPTNGASDRSDEAPIGGAGRQPSR